MALALAAGAALTLVARAAAVQDGTERSIGGGWMNDPDLLGDPTVRIRIGLEFPCGIDPDLRPSLEVTWDGNTFYLSKTALTSCGGADGIGRAAGEGVGSCNGERATVRFDFSTGSRVSSVNNLSLEGSVAGCALTAGPTSLDGGNFRFIEDPNI